MPPVVIPDASVLLKWVLPADDEPDVHGALSLRAAIADETVRALVPSLWLYEVGNTLARRVPAQAPGCLSALIKFGLEEAKPGPDWLAATLELTTRYGVSFYDAAYHALAILNEGTFVTADSRYVKRVESPASVMALGDWRAPPGRAHRAR